LIDFERGFIATLPYLFTLFKSPLAPLSCLPQAVVKVGDQTCFTLTLTLSPVKGEGWSGSIAGLLLVCCGFISGLNLALY